MPPNARVFLLDILPADNSPRLLLFYSYLTYYLYPREVAISLGQPPVFKLLEVSCRKAASLEELKQAGYDFAVRIKPDWSIGLIQLGSSSLLSEETRPKPIPCGDVVPVHRTSAHGAAAPAVGNPDARKSELGS